MNLTTHRVLSRIRPRANATRPTAGLRSSAIWAVVALVLLATLAPTPGVAAGASTIGPGSERDLIALTNRSRANAGLKALKIDSTLTSTARWRAKDMIARDYFSHDIPGYGSVFKKLDAKGYCYKLAGENIGWNTYPDDTATAAIHKMFMDSAGHRKNILNRAWDVIGVGAYQGPGGKKMWTVLFADKSGCGARSTTAKATSKVVSKAALGSTSKARDLARDTIELPATDTMPSKDTTLGFTTSAAPLGHLLVVLTGLAGGLVAARTRR